MISIDTTSGKIEIELKDIYSLSFNGYTYWVVIEKNDEYEEFEIDGATHAMLIEELEEYHR